MKTKLNRQISRLKSKIKEVTPRYKSNKIDKSLFEKLKKSRIYPKSNIELNYPEVEKQVNIPEQKIPRYKDTQSLIQRDIENSVLPLITRLKLMPTAVFFFLVYTLISGLGYFVWGYLPSVLFNDYTHTLVLSSLFPGRFGVFLNFVFFVFSAFLVYGIVEQERWNYSFGAGWYIIHAINFVTILLDSLLYNKDKFGQFTVPFTTMVIILNLLVIIFVFSKGEIFGIKNKSYFTFAQILFISFLIFTVFFATGINIKLSNMDAEFQRDYQILLEFQNDKLSIAPGMQYCGGDDICLVAFKNLIDDSEYADLNHKNKQINEICRNVRGTFTRYICYNYDLT